MSEEQSDESRRWFLGALGVNAGWLTTGVTIDRKSNETPAVGDHGVSGLRADLASAQGARLTGWRQDVPGAVSRTVEEKLNDRLDTRDFGAIGDRRLQQSFVQLALSAVPETGGRVENVDGAFFSLRSLRLPRRLHFQYRADDDRDTGFFGPDIGSGEQIFFSASSSYARVDDGQGNDPTGGVVNEWRFTAAFHPSLVVDVRKDVEGHDAYLAPGQSRLSPARASINIADEQAGVFRIVYQRFAEDWSKFDGTSLHSWRNEVFLPGIAASSWPTPPAVNDLVMSSRGAKGYFLKADATGTWLEWVSGRFYSGDRPRTATQTSRASLLSDSVDTARSGQPLTFNHRTGHLGIGLPPGLNHELLSVAGDIGLSPSYDFGQHIEAATAYPGIVWRQQADTLPGAGCSVRQASDEPAGRVWMYDGPTEAASPRGMLGAVCAAGRFGNGSPAPIANGFINVREIRRVGAGDYRVVFKRPMATAGYITVCTMDGHYSGGYTAGPAIEQAESVRIKVYDRRGQQADIPPNGSLHFAVLGGDI